MTLIDLRAVQTDSASRVVLTTTVSRTVLAPIASRTVLIISASRVALADHVSRVAQEPDTLRIVILMLDTIIMVTVVWVAVDNITVQGCEPLHSASFESHSLAFDSNMIE